MAKTYSDLFDLVISFHNLYLAFRKAAKGKRAIPDVGDLWRFAQTCAEGMMGI